MYIKSTWNFEDLSTVGNLSNLSISFGLKYCTYFNQGHYFCRSMDMQELGGPPGQASTSSDSPGGHKIGVEATSRTSDGTEGRVRPSPPSYLCLFLWFCPFLSKHFFSSTVPGTCLHHLVESLK